MSRIAKYPIPIPEKTEATKVGRIFRVKGPQGVITRDFRDDVKITIDESGRTIVLAPSSQENFIRALSGTYASHIKNMLAGVNTPYVKKLVIEGVGYKAAVSGDTITFNIGYSHPVPIKIPAGLTVGMEKNVISVSGIDKEAVGAFAAYLRSKKKPEPYKGKGIRYENEVVRRKQGKKSA